MKNILIGLLVLLAMSSCNAQKKQPVPDDLKPYFPTAESASVKNSLYTLHGPNASIVGYAAYSKPASDGIMGFKGETPLLILFGADKKVQQVIMLPNQDTPGFVSRVQQGGLLESWNGLTISEASKKDVDAVAGATYTSKGVIKSFRKALENIKL